jgi:hypothetical protein
MSSLEELFWHIDELCSQFAPQWRKSQSQRRNRRRALCLSEMLTILVAFHQQHYRNFKDYYLKFAKPKRKREKPLNALNR